MNRSDHGFLFLPCPSDDPAEPTSPVTSQDKNDLILGIRTCRGEETGRNMVILGCHPRVVSRDGKGYMSCGGASLTVGKPIRSSMHNPFTVVAGSVASADIEAQLVMQEIAKLVFKEPLDGTYKYNQ